MSTHNIRFVSVIFLLLSFISIPVLATQTSAVESVSAESALIDLSTMTSIGRMSTQGVKSKAYVMALKPTTDGDPTHRVVVSFANEKNGTVVKKALVGIKFRRLYGTLSEPLWMSSQSSQPEMFVSDVSLKRHGTYLFIIGSKLEDNKKRQFTFKYSY